MLALLAAQLYLLLLPSFVLNDNSCLLKVPYFVAKLQVT